MIAGIVASGLIASGPPPELQFGDPYGGGFYFGVMNYGVPGENYRLIIADKSTRVTRAWKTTNTATTFSNSLFNGQINTAALNNALHPAAEYCSNLDSGGQQDWYLPARNELELLYRNLKPSLSPNSTGAAPADSGSWTYGVNPNSVPAGAAYSSIVPAQTQAARFIATTGDQFIQNTYMVSSNQAITTVGNYQAYAGNSMVFRTANKAEANTVIAIRRELIIL